jgi:hypothetical protein
MGKGSHQGSKRGEMPKIQMVAAAPDRSVEKERG